MRLLLCLAEHRGEVVSVEKLLDQVWPGIAVSPDSVYQAVTSLRRLLGDNAKQPSFIATVPRLGYRMIAEVSPWSALQTNASEPGTSRVATIVSTSSPRFQTGLRWAIGAVICLALTAAFLFRGKIANHDHLSAAVAPRLQKSVAVLPFLDLTKGMKEEEFADGMTEELIDRLSKIPGLRIPSPTSSFYFKGKQMSIGEIAKTLNVAYVLDGSVRKSGSRVRIAARLIRADSAYVIWSESYDRPFQDRLQVQDDIASQVTRALEASLDSRPLTQ